LSNLSGSGNNGTKGEEGGSSDGCHSTKEVNFNNQLAMRLGSAEKKIQERGQLLFG
jgi:hypothetical protein